MNVLFQVLVQFAFRLTFGVAVAMGVTPSRLVTSGFYRVHLWVLMGINTFASLVLYSARDGFSKATGNWPGLIGLAIASAVACYAGSVVWLYEKNRLGETILYLVAALALIAAGLATPWREGTSATVLVLAFLDLVSSGLLLGTTMSAMLLGHWYLNTPTMELVPIRRLVALMIAAIVVRTLLCLTGLGLTLGGAANLTMAFWIWLAFRWLAGLLGTLTMAWLAWYTLKVPNTQSATGILYAGVILAFLGELVSQLLSVDNLYPV